jgi:hypothetical protein
MNAIAKIYKTLPHKSTTDDAKALLAFIHKDRHAFSAAGIYDGQIWAQFTDGALLAISNTEFATPSSKNAERTDPYVLPLGPRGLDVRGRDAASAPRAYVLGNNVDFGAGTIHYLGTVAAALRDVGYNVTFADASVDQLMAVHDAHAFLINTHGGPMPSHIAGGTTLRQGGYALFTTTPITASNDAKYADDIDDGAIYFGMDGYYNVETRQQQLSDTYVVSPYFFEKYVTFQSGTLDNSVAFFATCFSASPDLVAPLLTVLQNAGLRTYLGWTKGTRHVDDVNAALEFFNRTLPEDVTGNVIPVQHETPPQSASIVSDAFEWMQKENLTVSRDPSNVGLAPVSTGAASNLLLYEKRAPGVPQLAPILNQVTLFEYNKDQPGTPWIAGQGAWGAPARLSDITWGISSDPLGAIEPFPTPLAGYTESQDVRSTLLPSVTNGYIRLFEDGISSNVIPLTQWDGTITVEEKETLGGDFSGAVTLNADLNVSLRESVNPVRAQIDATPASVPAYFTDFMPISTGFLGGDGSYSNIYGGSPAVYKSNHQDAVVASDQSSARAAAVFNAALAGGSYAHTCGSAVDDPSTACLDIEGSGNNVATCTGGTPSAGPGSICPGNHQPSRVAWGFDDYSFCGPSGAYIPFTIVSSSYNLKVPASFTCAGGYIGPSPPPGLISEETTFTFKFGAPKSPPTRQTATGNWRTR